MDTIPIGQGPEKAQLPQIAREINQMTHLDQEMRERDDNQWDESVDTQNIKRMKEIVDQIGWPTTSKVGKESSHNAWLLVQHADFDVEFQTQCLTMMKQEPPEEVDRRNIAYLEDRILVNTGRPQLYGTQFNTIEGRFVPREIEDESHVDERRAQAGLGSLQEGIDDMYKKYGKDKPTD